MPIPVPGVNSVVGQGIDLGTDAINDCLGEHHRGQSRISRGPRQNGVAQMNYEAYASLVEAGVIPEDDVPDSVLRRRRRDLGLVRTSKRRTVPTPSPPAPRRRCRPWIPDEALENTYRSRFQHFYDDPGGEEASVAAYGRGLCSPASCSRAGSPPAAPTTRPAPSPRTTSRTRRRSRSHDDDQANQVNCHDIDNAEDTIMSAPGLRPGPDPVATVFNLTRAMHMSGSTTRCGRSATQGEASTDVSAGIDACAKQYPDNYAPSTP